MSANAELMSLNPNNRRTQLPGIMRYSTQHSAATFSINVVWSASHQTRGRWNYV